MLQTSEIIQQLDALSLQQLLEVRAKVDALIQKKQVGVGQSNISVGQIQVFYQKLDNKAQSLEDDSLEKVIEFVDEWMTDDSGYDEETYSEINASLNQNQLSF
ncbi:MAG: hypothetical protein KME30_33310 [Iphinoe sp. HA4291-MV1]|jgi:hypothetical protein|nr:hypothetical protein [Iphinoe sp. HA4291-MV1]